MQKTEKEKKTGKENKQKNKTICLQIWNHFSGIEKGTNLNIAYFMKKFRESDKNIN